MRKPTDKELNERLTEMTGFTPDDGWRLVRSRLRRGKVYMVVEYPSGFLNLSFLDAMPVELQEQTK